MPVTLWAFDTETFLIRPNDIAPKPVVCSWFNGSGQPFLTLPGDDYTTGYWADPEAHFVGQNMAYDLALMMRWHPHLIPAIVRAVDEGRVWDTQLRQQLIHLETEGERGFPKRISLSDLEKLWLGWDRSDQKKGDDIWRLKYGTLDGIPLDQWPADARQYAMDDAEGTWRVFQAQGGIEGARPTEQLQNQAALSLHLVSCWGFATNQANVAEIKQRITAKMQTLKAQLDAFSIEVDVKKTRTRKGEKEVYYERKTMGIVGKGTNPALYRLVLDGWRAKHMQTLQALATSHGVGIDWEVLNSQLSDDTDLGLWLHTHQHHGNQHMPAWCWDAEGWNPKKFLKECYIAIKPVPRSSKGPKTGENDVEDILEFVPILKTRADYKHEEKMLATYVTPYEGRETVHARFSPMVGTGRTSCEKPNLQNVPNGEGFRKNVWARPGYQLGTVDYSALELVTFAATIVMRYGWDASDMAQAINRGDDLHCITASGLFDRPYDEIFQNKKTEPYKAWRQGSKALNFGGLGGLGAKAFQPYAKYTYGVDWTLDECRDRIKRWKDRWPEVKRYLRDNGELCDGSDGRRASAINNSGRAKADCYYAQLCNYPFQSLAADGVKAALWELIKHQLLGWFWTESPVPVRQIAYGMIGDAYYKQTHPVYHNSPLRRSHAVNMVHDEIVMEHPDDLAEEAFALQQKIMVDTMAQWTSGVQPTVEGALMRDWEH